MKKFTDIDLDILNLLKQIPKDEENCVIYLRGENASKVQDTEGFIETIGTIESLTHLLFTVSMTHKTMRELFYNNTIALLHHKPNEQESFEKSMKAMKELPKINL